MKNRINVLSEVEIIFRERMQELRMLAVSDIKNCMAPSCQIKAIQSHLLQRKGILNKITPNGHLCRLDVNVFKEGLRIFKRAGLLNTSTFRGFCKVKSNSVMILLKIPDHLDPPFRSMLTPHCSFFLFFMDLILLSLFSNFRKIFIIY